MTFWEIVRFEIGSQTRRVSTWLYFVVLLVISFYLSLELSADYARADGSLANGPFLVAVMSLLWSTIGVLVASAIAGEVAARDTQIRMDPLVYTAPVSKTAYLGGRFLSAFTLYAVMLLAVLIGVRLAEAMPSQADVVGPFRPAAYLSAYAFLLLPNAFVATALMFSMAALTRRAVVSYFAGLILVGASAFNWTVVAGTWGRWELAKLLDPFGATVLGELSMVWIPAERSTRSIDLQGALLWNRVVWLALAVGVLALTHRRFHFAHPLARLGWLNRWRRRSRLADRPEPRRSVVSRSVRRRFGVATGARQMIAVASESFHAIVGGWGGVILVATAAFLVLSATPAPHMGVPLVPTTGRLLTFLAAPLANPQEINWIVVPVLLVFSAGELIWREREARLNEITDATPVADWVPLVGKFVGLSLVLVVLQALAMAGGLLTQALQGRRDFEISLYTETLFGLQLADYLLFALLALVLHTLVNHKYIGHLAGVLAYAVIAVGPTLGLEHHLVLYQSDPGWSYSDLRGFDPFIAAWLWFKLYWAAWAVLLALVAMLFRVQGTETNLRSRVELARRRWTRRTRRTAAAALTLILAIGAFIFYNTNLLNAYATAADDMSRRADYERRYGEYRNVPQPQLTGTTLEVEIYPERREVAIHGAFHLLNATTSAIDTIHLATKAGVDTSVRFDPPASEVLVDDRLGYRIYALALPLPPGGSLRLDFEIRFTPRGFSNRGSDASVVGNGTYFTNRAWVPAIGYQAERELRSAGERRAHGLPVRSMMPMPVDRDARVDPERTARVAFDAVVGTASGQIAVAPGRLRRTWTENGRQYFHYVADAPIRNDYAFFSAAYAVREAQWQGAPGTPPVSIEIVHHPAHAWNVDRMVRSAQASLDYYTKIIGHYPHGQLRFVEHAGDTVSLHASPINISYEEPFALLNPSGDPRNIDLPFALVAHEVAHQWWGNALTPAEAEGAGLLTETLAWYSALGVVEQTLGREHLQRLLDMMREVYLRPAARANVPLLRSDDQFLAYRKGPFAMYALREYVGAGRVDATLRRLFERYGAGVTPLPTSLDLYRELQAITPRSSQRLLADLFETNTFWELTTHNVTVEPAAGAWQVTLDVQARKVVVDEGGVESDVPMDDPIEVGVFAGAPGQGLGDTLYLQQHRVRSGRQRIVVTVPHAPARAGIDPRHLLIDDRGEDNLREIAARNRGN